MEMAEDDAATGESAERPDWSWLGAAISKGDIEASLGLAALVMALRNQPGIHLASFNTDLQQAAARLGLKQDSVVWQVLQPPE
jgi:hypothetical protein